MTSEGEANHGSDEEEDPFKDVQKNTSTSAIEDLITSKPALQSSILVVDPDSVRKKTPKPLKVADRLAIVSPVVEELTQDPEIIILSDRSAANVSATLNGRSMGTLRPQIPFLYPSDGRFANAKKLTGSVTVTITGSQGTTPGSTNVRIPNQSPLPSSLGSRNGPQPILNPAIKLVPSGVMGTSPFQGKTLEPRMVNNFQRQYRPFLESFVYEHPMLQASTHVIDVPSLVVPFVFEQPPEKSIHDFNLENSCNKDSLTNRIHTGSSSSSFESPLARFIIDLGLNIVENNIQTKKLNELVKKNSPSPSDAEKKLICDLKKAISENSHITKDFHHKMLKCRRCNFESESATIIDDHERIPHFESGVFHCPYCQYINKQPPDMLYHVKNVHHMSAKVSIPPKRFQCPNCTFETSTQRYLRTHELSCVYDPKVSKLLDGRFFHDIPGKMLKSPYKSWFVDYSEYWKRKSDPHFCGAVGPVKRGKPTPGPFRPYQLQGSSRFILPRNVVSTPRPILPRQSLTLARPTTPVNYVVTIDDDDDDDVVVESVSTVNASPNVLKNYPTDGSILICEICDCFLSDFNECRDHMFTIHKDPTFSGNDHLDPSLSCFKCSNKFFTGKGLERHLLTGHNLITMFWREKMIFSQDGGRCMECGQVFRQHIVDHYKNFHKRLMTNFNISYKCMICSSKFGTFDLFLQHFTKSHS